MSVDQSERFKKKKWQVDRKKSQAEGSQPCLRGVKDRQKMVWRVRRECVVGGGGKVRPLIDVKLVFEMEEQTRRLASEATRGCEGKMRGNEKVRDVCGVNFASDSSVVAGRAEVFANSVAIEGNPNETKDSGVDGWRGGAEVVDREVCFSDVQDRGQVK